MRRALFVSLLLVARPAAALDKQGSAHAGSIEGPSEGVAISGNAGLGAALYNPTYAARPNNTGLALFRALAHADFDLIGRRLSIPLDLNMFTDREARPGARFLVPSEFDVIAGVTSTWRLGPGALEGGVRLEHDRNLDSGGTPQPSIGYTQTYLDARVRYLMSLAAISPSAGDALADGDLSGWLTLGWFTYNPSYYARPDNTGYALLRYALHAELAVWEKRFALGVDTTFFTDRRSNDVLRPSELDLTTSLAFRPAPFEFQIAYERDMPADRGGLVQHFVYALATVSFDVVHPREE